MTNQEIIAHILSPYPVIVLKPGETVTAEMLGIDRLPVRA